MLMHWVVKTKNPSSRLGRSSPDIYMRPYARKLEPHDNPHCKTEFLRGPCQSGCATSLMNFPLTPHFWL